MSVRNLQKAHEAEEPTRHKATEFGLDVFVHTYQRCNGASVTHWQFVDKKTGKEILAYWPATGKVRAQRGFQGFVDDAAGALAEAVRRKL